MSRKDKYYQDLCAAKQKIVELEEELAKMQRLVVNLISHIEDECNHGNATVQLPKDSGQPEPKINTAV